MKTAIIVPTYNERENILFLIDILRKRYPEFDLLVIDDNSPDMTYEVVREFSMRDDKVKLLFRERKEGLGRALCSGYRYSMANGYQRLIQLDADFSHPPEYIDLILKGLNSAGLVIASRNIAGGGVENWSLFRILVSRLANLATSIMLRLGVRDATSGFRGFSRDFIEDFIKKGPISRGYIIQVETTFYARRLGYGIKEVPFIYRERERGKSKLDIKEVLISVFTLIRLAFKRCN
ncbi:MAG: polyprenol monophosphomannose synthase [Candidatus Kaelpia aquatica]|nr:polyprenol monophosphomannose synthase [Candidatus Kaelpia aquatica]